MGFWGGSRVQKIKVVQNGMKHVLILEFLNPMKFSNILCVRVNSQTSKQPFRHYSDQISCSARVAARQKKTQLILTFVYIVS